MIIFNSYSLPQKSQKKSFSYDFLKFKKGRCLFFTSYFLPQKSQKILMRFSYSKVQKSVIQYLFELQQNHFKL